MLINLACPTRQKVAVLGSILSLQSIKESYRGIYYDLYMIIKYIGEEYLKCKLTKDEEFGGAID